MLSKGPDPFLPAVGWSHPHHTIDASFTGSSSARDGVPEGVLVGAKFQGVDVLPGQMLVRGSAIDITLA